MARRKSNPTAEYLTVAQMADLLQISRSQAYDLIYRPDFPALVKRIGGRSLRVDRKRLEAWLLGSSG